MNSTFCSDLGGFSGSEIGVSGTVNSVLGLVVAGGVGCNLGADVFGSVA